MKNRIDFSTTDFTDVSSLGTPIQEAVMPLAAIVDRRYHHLGTGFVISGAGLMITARHVIEEFTRKFVSSPLDPNEELHLNGASLVALYAREDHENPGTSLFGGPLPITRITFPPNPGSDLALLSLMIPTFKLADGVESTLIKRDGRLDLPELQLSSTVPSVGDQTIAFGYTKMKSEGLVGERVSWHQKFNASRGVIQEIHPEKRDSVMINFPCFRTDAKYDSGMSGGPIIRIWKGSGKLSVAGVVSSGMEPHSPTERWSSYGALIDPIMSLQAPIRIDSATTPTLLTVREMCEIGIIRVSHEKPAID